MTEDRSRMLHDLEIENSCVVDLLYDDKAELLKRLDRLQFRTIR